MTPNQTGGASLIIGSKNYSSWSLRPWVFLRKVGFEFREQIIHFDAPDYRARIAAVSPSGRIPLVVHDGTKIWDSLAICEFGAEITERGLPRDRKTRALARSLAAEMHSGFQALRNECPMNIRARGRRVAQTPQLTADIARIDQLWSDCRKDFGGDGTWLFGEFSMADAMFAPVLFRFQTYGAQLRPSSQAYLERALEDPLIAEWQEAAMQEGHPLPEVDRLGSP